MSQQKPHLSNILEKVNDNISNARGLLSEAHILMTKEAEQLQQERALFEENANKLEHVHFGKTVKLDVGGVVYKTTLVTLIKDPNSMLAAMFSERFELTADADCSYFIDRDGELFRYILNYLRNGELLCSEETLSSMKHQLLAEAQFYQLAGLIEELSPVPKVFTESSIITSRDEENTLLTWICEQPHDTKWKLLYKATRDGWMPDNFHKKCDGKSPTLVVIKSGDNIFGGYADKPWSAPDHSDWLPGLDSFLFSLKNPTGFAPTKIYPKPSCGEEIVCGGISCCYISGPAFGTKSSSDIVTQYSDSNPRLGSSFLGEGFQTQHDKSFFVGAKSFLMHELEVFGHAQ